MVQFGSKLLPLLMAVATVNGYSWTRCTNADRCDLTTTGGPTESGSFVPGDEFDFSGGEIFAYDECSNFAYSGNNGYWYSHETDGLFVSPAGYVRFAHDCNLLLLASKSSSVGSTYWTKSSGADCCLPDEVGTNILNIVAYYTGSGN
ncbi:hypothetical protein BHYA_0779g00010 [Botrytis hyacinthi]|uniref:Uncharacterized protein n=1 Tax=Botrytis hyacinthi TaxID=278943 RepID=A0A4Z1G666_9HELO|nr:hypothetical protein BHYA_0779g00010 [Botrytis hyacinthi]